VQSPALDDDIKLSLRKFSKASAFRRAVLSMMAWSLNAEVGSERAKGVAKLMGTYPS
jgi:hypothetical protein